MSPEQANAREYGQAVDIWALGCVFYELLQLKPGSISLLSWLCPPSPLSSPLSINQCLLLALTIPQPLSLSPLTGS